MWLDVTSYLEFIVGISRVVVGIRHVVSDFEETDVKSWCRVCEVRYNPNNTLIKNNPKPEVNRMWPIADVLWPMLGKGQSGSDVPCLGGGWKRSGTLFFAMWTVRRTNSSKWAAEKGNRQKMMSWGLTRHVIAEKLCSALPYSGYKLTILAM